MHVLIDARMIGDQPHGIATHLFQLLKQMEKMGGKNEYTLLTSNHAFKKQMSFKCVQTISPWLSLSEQFELPFIIKKIKPDLYHSPSFSIPFYCPVPFILTLHDLNHVRCRDMRRFHTTLYYQTILKSAVQKTKKIITVSQFSKKEVIDYYKIPENKISVIYNGVSSKFSPFENKQHLEACRIKYRLPERFILWIGNSKKHKNLERLVRAFERLKTDFKLVLVGVNYQTFLSGHPPSPAIHSVGHVDAEDLVCLYQLSAFLVYPSLYEGFGLPVMEALACGKKIVVSDRPPLSEIAGTTAILVDPLDIDAIANAMRRLLSDPQTYQADQEGIRHSQKFSWEEAARKTIEVYENCNRS